MVNLIVSVLFLTAVVCQTTGQAQEYNQLDARVKKFVDLAIINANQQIIKSNGHLNFNAIGEDHNEVSSRVRIDVRLKNTNCTKAARAHEHRHRPECAFKQLEVWCMVCSPDPNTNDPFIDCVRKKDAKTRHGIWDKHCVAQQQRRRLPGEGSLVGASPWMNPGSGVVEDDNTTGTSLNVTADQENAMRMNVSDYYEHTDYDDGGYDDFGDTH